MESLADAMHEIEADIAIVTETWLQDRTIVNNIIDVAGEHGLNMHARNRQEEASNGRQYGGVAIFSRAASSTFKPLTISNEEGFEVYCVVGKIRKLKDRVAVVAVYIPPNYPKVRADACLDYISDVISEIKRSIDSPIIVVGGDWNQWPVEAVLDDHADMSEVEHGPTRGDRKIDRFLVNFARSISESDTLPPLDDGSGRLSDHMMAYFKASFPVQKPTFTTYKYSHFTAEGAANFQRWISTHDFRDVYSRSEVNSQLRAFLSTLESKMNDFFPMKTTTKRVSDPPWINPYIRTMVKKRRHVYHREGRSNRWKELMKRVRKLVKKRARNYWQHQKRALLKSDASRVFYKNVRAYSSKEKPPNFDVRSIFGEGETDVEIAEKLSIFAVSWETNHCNYFLPSDKK